MAQCFSCKGLVPDIEGPIHRYMLSSPGCWKLYGEILAREYAPENYDPGLHRITVDAYAVQHPGNVERRAIQSVSVHLISLYAIYEQGAHADRANALMKRALASKSFSERLRWLDPPSFAGTLTVADIFGAKNFREHADLVHRWGESVWGAWRDKHHDTVAGLFRELSA